MLLVRSPASGAGGGKSTLAHCVALIAGSSATLSTEGVAPGEIQRQLGPILGLNLIYEILEPANGRTLSVNQEREPLFNRGDLSSKLKNPAHKAFLRLIQVLRQPLRCPLLPTVITRRGSQRSVQPRKMKVRRDTIEGLSDLDGVCTGAAVSPKDLEQLV
jgi:hypothetical protein